MSKPKAIVLAAMVVVGGYVTLWLTRRAPPAHVTGSENVPLASGGSAQENIVDRRAAAKDLEEHEKEFINSLPPDKRAEFKWALQRWGNTDLKRRGAGGAH